MKISKKKHLEMILEKIPKHPNPKVELEQYSTPAVIASDLIWNAYGMGDIRDLNVLDLGCGTGILASASSLMGAKFSLGLDIDRESVDLARKSFFDLINENKLSHMDVANTNFIVGDINSYNSISDLLNDSDDKTLLNLNSLIGFNGTDFGNASFKFDTLIQNPPFGSQERGKRHADRKFIDFALNSAEIIYSFHMASSEEYIIDYVRNLGADVSHKLVYKFPIPKIYDFHTDEQRMVKVVVLRIENFE